jgi:DNA polymerase-3 subunit alpha
LKSAAGENGLSGTEDLDPDQAHRGPDPQEGSKLTSTAIDEEDPKTFEMLCRGRAPPSSSLKARECRTPQRGKPSNIEDLVALNALYRPGPMPIIPQSSTASLPPPITYANPELEEELRPHTGSSSIRNRS